VKKRRGFRILIAFAALAFVSSLLSSSAIAQDDADTVILTATTIDVLPVGADTLAIAIFTIAPGVSYSSAGTPEIDLMLVKEGSVSVQGGSAAIPVVRSSSVAPEEVAAGASSTLNADDSFVLPECTDVTLKNEGTSPVTLFATGIVSSNLSGCPIPATPTGGIPDGVDIKVIQTFPVTDWPPAPFDAVLASTTTPPGSSIPGNPDPGPTAAYIESGSYDYTLTSGTAWLAKASGLATATAGGGLIQMTIGETITVSAGDIVFETTGTISQTTNNGTEPSSAIGIFILPGTFPFEEGTPAA
jgi:hypothetical protein